MVQLGARQARYVGRAKTRLQMVLIAAVLNLLVVFNHSLHKQEEPVAIGGCPPPETPDREWPTCDADSPALSNDTAGLAGQTPVAQSSRNGIRGAPDLVLHDTRGDP
jgi:hypothetical protein